MAEVSKAPCSFEIMALPLPVAEVERAPDGRPPAEDALLPFALVHGGNEAAVALPAS